MPPLPSSLRRTLATSASSASPAPATRFHPRLGYVPEHFAAPIYFGASRLNLPASLHPHPSGTGHMIENLTRPFDDPEAIDIGIGLTESWLAKLARVRKEGKAELPYKLIGGFVESPLRWAISTGAGRGGEEVQGLRGRRGVGSVARGAAVRSWRRFGLNRWGG